MGAAAVEKEKLKKSRQGRPSAQHHNGSSDSMGSGGSSGLSNPPQQAPTQFAQAKFSADQWSEQLRTMSWNIPDTDKNRQPSNPQPSRSPKKPTRPSSKLRSTPQQPSVATEAEEEKVTTNGHGQAPKPQSEPAQTAPDVEAMDIDDELPFERGPTPPKQPYANDATSANYPDLKAHHTEEKASQPKKPQQEAQQDSKKTKPDGNTPLFDFDKIRNTAPFTTTNNGGIDNLADVHATLPFESRPRRNTSSKIRPRKLDLPNPPKRPKAPSPVQSPLSPGTQVLPRDKWQYYVSAMSTYMHEWNNFNKRMLTHFNARQEAIETGLSPGWISAVGDSSRLKMNGDDDPDKSGVYDDEDNEEDDLVPNQPKGGFSVYLRGIEEDNQVRKHWEVACEGHRECILDLGRLRDWIRNGGKVA